MKKYIIVILLIVLLSVFQSGCITSKITEKRPVLYLNVSIIGTYDRPTIDTNNTTAFSQNIPLIKNPRYDKVTTLPLIYSTVFYEQKKISYETSEPYHGPGNYLMTIAFLDGKPIPDTSEEFLVVLGGIIDSDGTPLMKEYVAVRWPESSDSP